MAGELAGPSALSAAGNLAIQRALAPSASPSGSAPAPATAATLSLSSGQSLPEPLVSEFSPRFGFDLSGVRVHSDAPAAQAAAGVSAHAFAYGSDIFFARGQWQPDTHAGRKLLAHELTHVVQQGRAGGRPVEARNGDGGTDEESSPAEREADEVAECVGSEPVTPVATDRTYYGDDESLTQAVTSSMSDDDLRATSAGTLQTLGAGTDEGALENRELVRYEMARRHLDQVPPPVPPGPQLLVEGIAWANDAAYVRYVIEQLFARQLGRTPEEAQYQVERHLRTVRERAGYSPVAGVPLSVAPEAQAEIDLTEAVLDHIRTQLQSVQAELEAFTAEFANSAKQLGFQILDESERRISHELERYGISREQITVWRSQHDGLARAAYMDVETRYSFDQGPEATRQRVAMMQAAREVAASERRVRTLRERRDLVAQRLATAESCAAPQSFDPDMEDMDFDGMGAGPLLYDICQEQPRNLVASAPQLRDLLGSLNRALEHLDQEHSVLRAEKEGEYPVIAAYTSGETIDLAGLDRLGSAPSAAAIGADAYEKLGNIRRVRAALGDDLSIYELPQLLELAKARFNVAPISPRAGAIQAEIEERQSDSMWRSIGIMVLSIGLGLIAAIPTAGGSLAVTGAVIAAEVAGLALDAYLLYQSVEEYQVRGALTNTDFDRARVLSHDEPSLFWLAVDIIGFGIGLAGATSTFRQAARLRRAALAARNADEVGQQLAELRRLRDAGQLSAEAAQRLEREILRDLPDQAIARALGVASDATRPAADVAAAMGRSLGDVVGADDLARLSDELGVPIVSRTDLGDGVHVVFELVDGRIARARSIAIGAGATVGDVLGHRETVQLLRRMEAATTALGRQFEDLLATVVDSSGRVNPFPAGSQAFNSWMELRKYPELLQQRLARLGQDGVSRSERELLREQVSFFETELAHHRDIVARSVLERGDDFIARAARSNEAALAAGYPPRVTLPDGRSFPIGEAGSQFYYAVDGSAGTQRYILRRYVDAVDAPSITLTRGANGAWEAVEGALSRTEAAEALVRGWPAHEQEAFRLAREAAEAATPGARVVPLAGIHRTDTTIGSLLTPEVTETLRNALAAALSRTNSPRRAQRLAREAMARLSAHQIVVVRGTDQLRAFGYRRAFSAGGEVIEGDLHHWIPLYLGGDHRLTNLFDLDPTAHRSIHEALEGVEFATTTLDPNRIGRLDLDFEHGLGILMPDGSIQLEALAQYSVAPP